MRYVARMRMRHAPVLALVFAAVPACAARPSASTPPPLTTAQPTASPRTMMGAQPSVAPAPGVDLDFPRTLALTNTFRFGMPQHIRVAPDGRSVLFLRSGPREATQALYETDLATGDTRLVLAAEALLGGAETLSAAEAARRERARILARGFSTFEQTEDGANVVVPLSGRIYVLNRATKQTRELATGAGAAIDPQISPDGKTVGYVRGNDVYVAGIDGAPETAVTKAGSESLTHGSAEFVAQEELGRSRGFWFSPDGSQIAYEEADTGKVEQLIIADPAHPERAPVQTPYPRPGQANADVHLGIVKTRGGATTWVAWDHGRYPYLVVARWDRGAPLTLYVMDRLQKNAALLAVDAANGTTTTLLEEHDDAWLNHDTSMPRWLPDGKTFLWSTERRGAWQLELHAATGALVRELTKTTFGYSSLAGIDGDVAVVNASDDPTEMRAYAVPIHGGDPKLLRGDSGEYDSAVAEPGGNHIVATCEQSRTSMPRCFARSSSDSTRQSIPSVAEAPASLPHPEFVAVGPEQTRVSILRPRGFVSGRRYPVIDAAYAGPNVNLVVSTARTFLRDQWIADMTGAIVVSIDARGTPHRGRDWERAISGKLALVPLDGHIEALRALAALHPEMDLARVGVYGWSYGGYYSALAVLARPDFYKVGFAAAPPADWRDYDTCYTERYLGLPEANAAAYDEASLLTYARTKALPRRLLLAHGTADDNVFFLNSMKLVDALERAGKPFEFFPLAGSTHRLVDIDMNEALWTRAATILRDELAL